MKIRMILVCVSMLVVVQSSFSTRTYRQQKQAHTAANKRFAQLERHWNTQAYVVRRQEKAQQTNLVQRDDRKKITCKDLLICIGSFVVAYPTVAFVFDALTRNPCSLFAESGYYTPYGCCFYQPDCQDFYRAFGVKNSCIKNFST